MTQKKQYIYGLHAIRALLEKQPERLVRLFLQASREDEKVKPMIALAARAEVAVEYVARQQLDRMTADGNHQGAVALVAMPRVYRA